MNHVVTSLDRARHALMLEGAFTCIAKDLKHGSVGAIPCGTCDTLLLRVKREIEEAVEAEKKTVRRQTKGRRASDK